VTARIYYIDDSGSVDTGLIVYGWAEVDIASWSTGLQCWLDFRKKLYSATGVPADYELHSTYFIGGRGEPSGNPVWDRHKRNRSQVAQDALAVVASMPGTRVGAVYRQTTAKGRDYHRERAAVYEALLHLIDTDLTGADDHGIIVMDGNGTDPSYQGGHRKLKLATRRIVEDPWFVGSDTSQPVQIADLVAYTAYQTVLRHPGKKFMWQWWTQHLPGAIAPRPV
jgi:hypothetical protein